jgi:hypothetical protein
MPNDRKWYPVLDKTRLKQKYASFLESDWGFDVKEAKQLAEQLVEEFLNQDGSVK